MSELEHYCCMKCGERKPFDEIEVISYPTNECTPFNSPTVICADCVGDQDYELVVAEVRGQFS